MNKKYAGSFHLKPAFLFVKYCHETPTKNCRVCAYLLININEASPRTGNMLVVFILNQPFGYKILSGNPDFYSKWWRAIIGDLGKLRKKLFIINGMYKNQISVSPQILSDHLTILHIKLVFSL